jgi:hypothetical protein
MPAFDIEYLFQFIMSHTQFILGVLVIALVLIFMVNHWRERKLIKQMDDFWTVQHQDVLVKNERLAKSVHSIPKPLNMAVKKPPSTSAFDQEFDALKHELDMRLKARDKN